MTFNLNPASQARLALSGRMRELTLAIAEQKNVVALERMKLQELKIDRERLLIEFNRMTAAEVS